MKEQDLKATLIAWQWGEIGYRDALCRSGLPSLFHLYEAAHRLGVPIRKNLLPREERAVALATADLLADTDGEDNKRG